MSMTAWATGQHEIIRARIAAHRAAGEIIQVVGWDGKRGGAIRCSVHDAARSVYADLVTGNNTKNEGLDVAYLVGQLHELLPGELSLDWPGRVANALTPGADTTHVWSYWCVWLLRVELRDAGVLHTEQMAALFERRIAGDEPSRDAWEGADEETNAAVASYVHEGTDICKHNAYVHHEDDASHTYWASTPAVSAYANVPRTKGAAERMADALIEIMVAATPCVLRDEEKTQ